MRLILTTGLDKTQVFHDKIEIKQKELQPWTAKINAKQAEIDLATNERDMLAKKAEAAKVASKEAQDQLEQLRADNKAKACLFSHGRLIVLTWYHRLRSSKS